MELIIEYLITKGGLWGVFLAASFMWIFWRETNYFNKGKTEENASKEKDELQEIIISHAKEIKFSQQQSVDSLLQITNVIDSFKNMNQENSERILQLTDRLQKVNDNRVEELKEILSEYNSTMKELNMALEQIKFILKQRIEK